MASEQEYPRMEYAVAFGSRTYLPGEERELAEARAQAETQQKAPLKAEKASVPAAPAADPVDYAASWNKDDLQREVERRGIAVEGTGVNGRILKEDLVAALSADDATRATG